MTSKERNLVEMVVATVLSLSPEARGAFWELLDEYFCRYCGDRTDGQRCYCRCDD